MVESNLFLSNLIVCIDALKALADNVPRILFFFLMNPRILFNFVKVVFLLGYFNMSKSVICYPGNVWLYLDQS